MTDTNLENGGVGVDVDIRWDGRALAFEEDRADDLSIDHGT